MNPLRSLILAAAALPLAVAPVDGQSIAAAVDRIDAVNALLWARPVVEALVDATAVPMFSDAGAGHGLVFGLRVSGARSAGGEAFAVAEPDAVTFDGRTFDDRPWAADPVRSPTAAGTGAGAVLRPRPGSAFEAALLEAGRDPSGAALALPAGLEASGTWRPTLEASVGLGGFLRVAGRASPTVEVDGAVGDVSGFGGGVLLSTAPWLPLPGFALAVTAGRESLRAGGWLDGSVTTWGAIASADLRGVRLHASALADRAEWTLVRTVSNPAAVPLLPADGTVVRSEDARDWRVRTFLGADALVGPLGVLVSVAPFGDGGPAATLRLSLGLP